MHNNINIIDKNIFNQTEDIIALFETNKGQNEVCYQLNFQAGTDQLSQTKIQLQLDLSNARQKESQIEIGTLDVKKCDKLKEKNCHMLFKVNNKQGNLLNMQQTSVLKLYPSEQEKLTSQEMILKKILFEYQLIYPKPFLWTCAKNPIEKEDKNNYNLQRRFVSLENILNQFEETFMTDRELNKRLLLSSILLKKTLILIQNLGGMKQYKCEQQNDQQDLSLKLRQQQFKNSIENLLLENQINIQENPLDYLVYLKHQKFNKYCQDDFFRQNPIFLSELYLNSFSFNSDKLEIDMHDILEKKIVIEWNEVIDYLSNKKLLIKKILETLIGKIVNGEIENQGVLELDDQKKIQVNDNNIQIILRQYVSIYNDIILQLYDSINFSPLVIPKFHYEQSKNAKPDFHDIMLKFEQQDKRIKQNKESEQNKAQGNDQEQDQNLDTKYRKHFIIRTYFQFMQKFIKQYISEDLNLFNCFKPYTKFQYDNCPEFMQELINSINKISNKKIRWSSMRDLIFGYVFEDIDKLNVDLELFINNIFIYSRNKLLEIQIKDQENINIKQLIEGIIAYENVKIDNLRKILNLSNHVI